MRTTAIGLFRQTVPLDATQEAATFAKLKMRNGTFKMTKPSRFKDLEAAISPFIANMARDSEVLDIGVSTGITAVELSHYMRSNGISARLTATDVFIDAFVVPILPGLTVLCDGEGWPLQYDVRGFPLRPWIRRLDYITLAFVPLTVARRILQPRLKAAVVSGKGTRVQLTTRLLPQGADIRFVENDITARTAAFVGRFGFARAANILNLNYFPPEQIQVALGNIRTYLKGAGSLLLITRTDQAGKNNGTLFELAKDGLFRPLVRIGRGSEIEHLVVGLEEDRWQD
jgi:hypothetical protein